MNESRTDSISDSWLAPASLFLVSILFFSINLGRPPHPDELHHVLAAQHLLDTGRPIIAHGEYWRVLPYTWMVAMSYEVFGESLWSARIPSVLLVASISPVLFLWLRREAGPLAAWIGASLFVSSPFTVEIAQFCRFYSLQMLSFVLGSLCVYYAFGMAVSPARRLSLGVLASALLFLAVSTQITTLVGVAGLGAWVFGFVVQRIFVTPGGAPVVKWVFAVGVLAAGILAVFAATQTDLLASLWGSYRDVRLSAADMENDFWFYHLRFLLFYPTLWTLVGVLGVFAVVHRPRLGWLAVSTFAISFLVMSFGGNKGTRYLSFAQPFLTIVWSLGLACVSPFLWRLAREGRDRLSETLALPRALKSTTGAAVFVAAGLAVFLTNAFWLRTAAVIGDVALPGETPVTNWRAARESLARWTDNVDIMITTEELGALYFLGRSDIRFSPSKLEELDREQRHEFGIDYRTGLPVIATPQSVQKLIECFSHGIVVGPLPHWGDPVHISDEIETILRRYAKPIEVPAESHLYAWGWTHEVGEPIPARCAELSRFSHAGEIATMPLPGS